MRSATLFLISTFVIISFTNVYSQLMPEDYDTLIRSKELRIGGNVDYYGTSIQNDLLSKFIRGGYITEDIKNNSFDRHKAINRLGGLIESEIEFHNFKNKLFKKRDLGYVLKGGYNVFAGMLYSKDLFGAAFYGNDMYLGETMDFSGSKLNVTAYQKIGFGIIDPKTKSSVTFNIYNVSNRVSGHIKEATIFQHEDGNSIDFVLDGDFELKRNKKFSQGIGIGVDVDLKIPVNWIKERKAFIQFKVQDFGGSYMHEKQKVYSVDTSFTFSGFKLTDLVGENAIFNESFNILDTLGLKFEEKNRFILMPGYVQVAKIVDALQENKWQSFFGIRLYTTLIYSPFVFGGIDFKAAKWINIGASLSYGGFGKLRGGLYASAKFRNYSVGLSSDNVVGWFSPKNSSGQSVNLRLRWAI